MRKLSSMLVILGLCAMPGASRADDHKDGEPFDHVGRVHYADVAFIGGEGCNITFTPDGAKDAIGLQCQADSPTSKSLKDLSDKQAHVTGQWHLHKGVETKDFWFVDVASVKADAK